MPITRSRAKTGKAPKQIVVKEESESEIEVVEVEPSPPPRRPTKTSSKSKPRKARTAKVSGVSTTTDDSISQPSTSQRQLLEPPSSTLVLEPKRSTRSAINNKNGEASSSATAKSSASAASTVKRKATVQRIPSQRSESTKDKENKSKSKRLKKVKDISANSAGRQPTLLDDSSEEEQEFLQPPPPRRTNKPKEKIKCPPAPAVPVITLQPPEADIFVPVSIIKRPKPARKHFPPTPVKEEVEFSSEADSETQESTSTAGQRGAKILRPRNAHVVSNSKFYPGELAGIEPEVLASNCRTVSSAFMKVAIEFQSFEKEMIAQGIEFDKKRATDLANFKSRLRSWKMDKIAAEKSLDKPDALKSNESKKVSEVKSRPIMDEENEEDMDVDVTTSSTRSTRSRKNKPKSNKSLSSSSVSSEKPSSPLPPSPPLKRTRSSASAGNKKSLDVLEEASKTTKEELNLKKPVEIAIKKKSEGKAVKKKSEEKSTNGLDISVTSSSSSVMVSAESEQSPPPPRPLKRTRSSTASRKSVDLFERLEEACSAAPTDASNSKKAIWFDFMATAEEESVPVQPTKKLIVDARSPSPATTKSLLSLPKSPDNKLHSINEIELSTKADEEEDAFQFETSMVSSNNHNQDNEDDDMFAPDDTYLLPDLKSNGQKDMSAKQQSNELFTASNATFCIPQSTVGKSKAALHVSSLEVLEEEEDLFETPPVKEVCNSTFVKPSKKMSFNLNVTVDKTESSLGLLEKTSDVSKQTAKDVCNTTYVKPNKDSTSSTSSYMTAYSNHPVTKTKTKKSPSATTTSQNKNGQQDLANTSSKSSSSSSGSSNSSFKSASSQVAQVGSFFKPPVAKHYHVAGASAATINKKNALEREEEAQKKKAELLQKKQELQKKKNEEWKQKAEKIKMMENEKKAGKEIPLIKPSKFQDKQPIIIKAPPINKPMFRQDGPGPSQFKPSGPMKPFTVKPVPPVGAFSNINHPKTPTNLVPHIVGNDVFKTPGNVSTSFLDVTTDTPVNSYDITVYEDLDEELKHRENKVVPEWANNRSEIAVQLFKQVHFRDHNANVGNPFPKPERGYKFFPKY